MIEKKRLAKKNEVEKFQRKRGHEESEEKEETKIPKRTSRRKLFTLNEYLNAIVCAIRGERERERVEHGNELLCDDCKDCKMTQSYQDITRIILQIHKMTHFLSYLLQ
jgi:hypothetical protein